MANKKTFDLKKVAPGIIGILIALAIIQIPQTKLLTIVTLKTLAIFTWAIIWWCFSVIPTYATGILMLAFFVIFKCVSFADSFSAFSGTSMWIMIGALIMVAGLIKIGVMRRLSLVIMKLFPGTFAGMTMGLMTVGTALTPLCPTAAAKTSITAPFANSIAATMGYEKNSPQSNGLFAAIWMTAGSGYPLFLSASFFNFTVKGLMPPEAQASLDWFSWFKFIFPWGIVVIVGSYFAIKYLYASGDKKSISKEFINKELESMGPMSTKEKIGALLLIGCLVMWMTESVHGISAALVVVVAMCIAMACEIVGPEEIKTKTAWDIVLFLGSIMGIPVVFAKTGVNEWMKLVLSPYLTPFLSNIVFFIIAGSIFIYLTRFVVVSMITYFTMFSLLLMPVAINMGMHPFIVGIVGITSTNVWLTAYQNPNFMIAMAFGGDNISFKPQAKMSMVYMVLNIIGLLACIPVWKFFGLLPV